jgi:hypothetical protein
MPISVESDTWQDGENPGRLHNELLQFLQEHSDQAFRPRELADELLGTQWAEGEETERLREQLTEEEFNERLHEGELPDEDAAPIADFYLNSQLDNALMKLLDMDLIEQREVDAGNLDIPFDWDTVIVITYSGFE